MSARLSGNGRYRHALWRDTGRLGGEGTVLFVMLNPSTADATEDDPTIRRCIAYAGDWGYAALSVANAYGLRATDPRELWRVDDPVGPDNDAWLTDLAAQADEIVVAWGANIEAKREREVSALLARGGKLLCCLGRTHGNHPRHPLYLTATAMPHAWTFNPRPSPRCGSATPGGGE